MASELFLIRHAEAVDKTPEVRDLDRQLSSDGLRNSARQGETLKKNNILPDLIVCSSAIRAHSTAQLIAERVGYETNAILMNDEVYEASVRTLLTVVNQFNDKLKCIFIVGHNPSVTYLAEFISNSEIGELPPGAIVRLKRLSKTWSDVNENNCELISCYFPEDKSV